MANNEIWPFITSLGGRFWAKMLANGKMHMR